MQKLFHKLINIVLILIICYLISILFDEFSFIISGIIFVILPFLVGFSLAFIMQPIVIFFSKYFKKPIAVVITIILFIGTIFLLIYFGSPLINKQLNMFIRSLPDYIDDLLHYVNTVLDENSIDFVIDSDYLLDLINNYQSLLIKKSMVLLESFVSIFIQIVTCLIVFIYFVIYFDDINEYLKKKSIKNEPLYNTLKEIKNSMRAYFKGFFLVIGLLTLFASLSFLLLGFDLFLLFGIIIGLFDIIPYIGPYIGGAIVCLFVISIDKSKLVYSIIILVILQLIEGMILTPKIQGKRMEMNPILVIFSVTLFGKLLGIIGMIIAVPLIRIMQVIWEYFFKVKFVKK